MEKFKFTPEMVGKQVVRIKPFLLHKSELGDEYNKYDRSYVGDVMTLIQVKPEFIEVKHRYYGEIVFSRHFAEWGNDEDWTLYTEEKE